MSESQPVRPCQPTEPTLDLLLCMAIAAENSREHNQRVLERTSARSSLEAYGFGAQIAALESCDPWAGVPAALRLRAFANNAFGTDLTPEAVRRIRGRVCEALDIDTATADALTLTQVVEVLAEADAEDKRHLSNPDGTADPLQTEFRWLKVTQIAKLFALNPGQVSKQADAGTFLANGKTGHDRRIDVLSVVKKELERLNRSSSASAFTDE